MVSMNTERNNPADLKPEAVRLLAQVAFAVALTDPETARKESHVESDVELHIDDEVAGETIYTNALVDGVTMKDSLVAPLVRLLAGRRSKSVKANYQRRSQKAARDRLEHAEALEGTEKVYLTLRSTRTFPATRGRFLSPLEIHWSSGPRSLALSPYQLQACGVIEIVRASGALVGPGDGDWLADQFMRMVIDLSGEGSWEDGAKAIYGGFLSMIEKTNEIDKEWTGLDGRGQLLAVTVLASWIRMSRLGVLLASKDRMGGWRSFFDGTLYGVKTSWLGEIWDVKAKKETPYELAEPWRAKTEPPWIAKSSGSPVPVIGIAGEILKMAIVKIQAFGMAPDDFVIEAETEQSPDYEESSRILVQLKRAYREIAESPIGSVICVSAPEVWN